MPSFAHRVFSAIRDGRVMSGLQRRWSRTRRNYLRDCKGVVHIGANDGAESTEYANHDLRVLWVEPLPEIFARLKNNIAQYGKQEALCALVTDRDGDIHTLNVSDDLGRCSSILVPGRINDVLPNVRFIRQMQVTSTTLASIMRERDIALYDALIIDAQGAELLILRGGEGILHHFRYVECEGIDYDFYENYPHPDEIRALLRRHGFSQIREDTFRKTAHGREFDMLFRRS